MRFFIEVAYNGMAYSGWQKQANALSIQEVIEEKLSLVLKGQVSIYGSGRTDAGVHAEGQVFHIDSDYPLDEPYYLQKFNSILPNTIVIKQIRQVHNKAHARHDAVERVYQYRITLQRNPFLKSLALYYPYSLNIDMMNKAAGHLVSPEQSISFEAFSRVKTDVSHFNCLVQEAQWYWYQDAIWSELLVFHIRANRFLRGMVRTIAGTLLLVGKGDLTPEAIPEIMDGKDRTKAGKAMEPYGLYLTKVKYPESVFI